MKGIDVSSHNGSIDFNEVRNSGIEVVIIKATEGVDFRDDYLDQHYNGANGVIPHVGFYHFMSERTEPRQQARDFYEAIKGKTYDVKPCLDIETNTWERTANEITNRCLEFIDEFKNVSGQDIMVYTGGYFGRDSLDSRIKCYGGWIAHYGVDSPMDTGFSVVGHQYSESGRVNGICSNVDMNNFNEGIFLGNANRGFVQSAPPQPQIQVNEVVLQLQQLINQQGFGTVSEDGRPGPETLEHCPTVSEGANGQITQWIQLRVGANPDGDFGLGTRDAVIGFQFSRGLSADGIVGPDTWRQLLGL